MDRTTGRAEMVRAALECIAYQISDVIFAMEEDSRLHIEALRVDGGPTRNRYLMQFQSDLLQADLRVPRQEELPGIGAAYMAGLALGIWGEDVFEQSGCAVYRPQMAREIREKKYAGWQQAVNCVLSQAKKTDSTEGTPWND